MRAMAAWPAAVWAAAWACAAPAGGEELRAVVSASPRLEVGVVSRLVYGQFLEHFHRDVYGGLFDPGSPLADARGFRRDVIEALRRIRVPVLRWPGGCFASAYHWQDGTGPARVPTFDKAWRVEDPNTFGTAEFVAFCRAVGAAPYICGNAGTGTPEELSDWVEYCNQTAGKWARLRAGHGLPEPLGVRIWSIGNENWGGHEIGAKTAAEFARFVTEAAKMIRRVDGRVELIAPSVPEAEWNRELLAAAGPHIDHIAIHTYADPLWQRDDPAPYARCANWSADPEHLIARTEGLLRALDCSRIRIAFDEWNLRGWHHPDFTSAVADIPARARNDLAATYTCADAVYAGCFLNACLRHADTVSMANFAPAVNVRGCIFTHPDGIVLRPTYHVFDLFANHALPTALDTAVASDTCPADGLDVPAVDAVLTASDDGRFALAAVNRHASRPARIDLQLAGALPAANARLWTVTGAQPDSFNDIGHPEDVRLTSSVVRWDPAHPACVLPPHSVNMLCFSAQDDPATAGPPLTNGGFETLTAPTLPHGWRPVHWAGPWQAAVATEHPHAGRHCLVLESAAGADCAWAQPARVRPHTRYRLAGWIRTEDVEPATGKGALLNVQELQGPSTPPLSGSHPWTRVDLQFDSGPHERLQVNCLLGGWGSARGKAFFDDLTLEPLE